MKQNMGSADKTLRLILAAVFILLAVFKVITGTLAILLVLFGVVFALTSFIGFCPLYLPFNISTKKKNQN
ncbi:MAG: DUF2892 domain-containing protein [Chitinophagaceae bacterium]|nr:DUF2892 domain-containing protein [Chitinophagaceae bacterium]